MKFVTLFFFTGLCATSAFGYCSQPTAPFCASSYREFSDRSEFDRCRREMETYQEEIQSYVRCSRGEIDDHQDEIDELRRKSQAAVTEYNDAVDGFNRRARR